jgi:hypothetical protein
LCVCVCVVCVCVCARAHALAILHRMEVAACRSAEEASSRVMIKSSSLGSWSGLSTITFCVAAFCAYKLDTNYLHGCIPICVNLPTHSLTIRQTDAQTQTQTQTHRHTYKDSRQTDKRKQTHTHTHTHIHTQDPYLYLSLIQVNMFKGMSCKGLLCLCSRSLLTLTRTSGMDRYYASKRALLET